MMMLGATSLYMLPSEAGASTCPYTWMLLAAEEAVKVQPTQCLANLAVATQLQVWTLLFLLGLNPSDFLRAPGVVWGKQRWQRPDLQELWFSSSLQSKLRHRHLSQLDLDTILNMETKGNLL